MPATLDLRCQGCAATRTVSSSTLNELLDLPQIDNNNQVTVEVTAQMSQLCRRELHRNNSDRLRYDQQRSESIECTKEEVDKICAEVKETIARVCEYHSVVCSGRFW